VSDDLQQEEGLDASDQAFTEAADLLMQAIDAFREAGLSNEDIVSEVKARMR
jgi:phosphoribosyl-ATP pyrophosphohydrolase